MDLFDRTERKRYRTILMDPPWKEAGGGKVKRGADRHYPLMDVGAIRRTILDSGVFRPAEDAHLWMWFTDNFMEDALWLARQLGFRPIRQFVWVKTDGDDIDLDDDPDSHLRMGIGQYGRGCHEGLLLCVRGRGQSPEVWTGRRDVRSVFHAAHVVGPDGKRIHSAKPPRSYELIESVSKGPRIEFFARRGRISDDGFLWDVWGNQAPEAA